MYQVLATWIMKESATKFRGYICDLLSRKNRHLSYWFESIELRSRKNSE
jgi:hypothetical protein